MYELTLSDFEYEINGGNLIFQKLLNNKEKNIKLLDKYNIDGKDYIVNEIGYKSFRYGKISYIELPDTIEKIGYGAFYGSGIEKFVVPQLVTEIPENCFLECKNLTDVVLHDDIEEFGNCSFCETKIKKIIIPHKVTKIPDGCFFKCCYINDIELNNVKELGQKAFSFSSIDNIDCSNVKEINNYCFFGCSKLKNIKLNNVKKINKGAFSMCISLEKIKIPENLNTIPEECFLGCSKLKDIILNDNIETIQNNSFSRTVIETFIVPPKVVKIPKCCFLDCINLKKINLNNVKHIEHDAFTYCKYLNISYQNNESIYIDDYDELINKGFVDGQINQIFKGYENQIYLNNLPTDTPVELFRKIINIFNRNEFKISEIIKQIEKPYLMLNDKIELYKKINTFFENNKNINNIEHII